MNARNKKRCRFKELLTSDCQLVMSVETIPDKQYISVGENKSKRTVTENVISNYNIDTAN